MFHSGLKSSRLPFLPEVVLFQIQNYYHLQISLHFLLGGLFAGGYHVAIWISKVTCVSPSGVDSSLGLPFTSVPLYFVLWVLSFRILLRFLSICHWYFLHLQGLKIFHLVDSFFSFS